MLTKTYLIAVGLALSAFLDLGVAQEPPDHLKKLVGTIKKDGLPPEGKVLPFSTKHGVRARSDLDPRGVTDYPELRSAGLLPVNGYFYRVSLASEFKLLLEWIPGKDLPPGLSLQKDSLIVPFGTVERAQPGGRALAGSWVSVIAMEKPEKHEVPKVLATLRGWGSQPVWEATVTQGDLLLLSGGRRVLAVVPPDRKLGIEGWVELAGNAIPEAELVSDKVPTVRPSPAPVIPVGAVPPDWLKTIHVENGLYCVGPSAYHKTWLANPGADAKARVRVEPNYLLVEQSFKGPIHIDYPDVRVDDVLAIFGFLYRVASVSGDEVELRCIAEKDRPPGVAVKRDSLFVPLKEGNDGGAFLHGWYLYCKSIDKLPKGPVFQAFMEFEHVTTKGVLEKREAMVQSGEVLLIGGKGHKVRSIVSQDPKTRVRGWVELAPEPIPEADLVRDKTPFVRPKPQPLERPPR